MKIKTKNAKNSSMQLIVPVDGLITVDSNGIAEVSSKCAVTLVTCTDDWEYLKKVNTPELEENDEEEDETEEDDNKVGFSNHLEGLTLAQMKDLAKEGEMPEEEYEKINSKKLMKAYLLKKYDESNESVEE